MPTLNPKYRSDWESIHDQHSAERDRIGTEMQSLRHRDRELNDAGQADDSHERLALFAERERLLEQWDGHHQACLESFQMQHRTIQEYAAWVFTNFPVTGNAAENDAPAVNFETFTTLDDVGVAWHKAKRNVMDEARKNRSGNSPQRIETAPKFS
jgi:hypothetical protein